MLLLLGVLFTLLQGGLQDSPYNQFRVQGPFGVFNPFFQPFRYFSQHPRESPSVYRANQNIRNFDRSNIEYNQNFIQDGGSNEYSFRTAEDDDRVPLRDAVEKIPKEGEMNILLRSSISEEDDDTPFSRTHVEAYPEPQIPYNPNPHIINILEYMANVERDNTSPLIGFRGDVEAPPTTPYVNPFTYFRKAGQEGVSKVKNFQDIWKRQQTKADVVTPVEYTSWNTEIRFNPHEGEQRVVCYFDSWSVLRPKPVNFDVKDIDPFSCTHLIYSFAGLDNDTLTITALDETRDVIQGAYKATVALKSRNPNLKVMIAIGGWAEGGTKYSKMVSTQESRDTFVKSVVNFMNDHRFDGLDLDWEYPSASDRGGQASDKENLALLCEQLHTIFQEKGWLLTMAFPIVKSRIDEGYDIPRLSKTLDFFNLMVYDLRGPWDGHVDHHAPIGPRSSDRYVHHGLNMVDGIQLFVNYGTPRNKIVVGVPFYGRSFTLEDPAKTEPNSKSRSVGMAGKYTDEKGYISYFEICMEQRNGGWDISRDENGGPYMAKDGQWIGYDDDKYIEAKVNLIKHENLGGVMTWALSLDDYLGLCGTRWPLLSALRRTLHAPKKPNYVPTITQSPSMAGQEETTMRSPDEEEDTHGEVVVSEVPLVSPNFVRPGDTCSGTQRVPSKTSCQGYLVCNQGEFMEMSCGAGLHWNNERKICDWPEEAKCRKRIPIKPEDFEEVAVSPAPDVPVTSLEKAPMAGPLSGDYMVVCYFTNWAWYRPGLGKYTPDDIDENICTHIVYGFAVLDYSNLIIKPHDAWADIDNKFYEKVTALRAKGIKVTIAIGGWNDSAGDKYSRLVNNPSARTKFINHVVGFIKQHNFDGLDLDWEYPVCWQVNCDKGPASDKEAFGQFVKELSMAFRPQGLLLSAAVSPSKKVIDMGYDVPTLNKYLDWIAVMTYDFHGHWDKKTGHVAPMYYHPEDDYDYFNMDFAIRYWNEKGADKKKIVLGMPLYGQAFTLNNPSVNGLNAPANQKGKAGEFTRAAGFLAYYEICKFITYDGWNVVKDPEGRMGPYAYKNNQWVSFDDVATIRKKSQYIRDMGLGGGMVWALDLDDFTNRCGQGKHPLMKTIQSILGPAETGQIEAVAPGAATSKPQPVRPPVAPQPQPQPQPQPEIIEVSPVVPQPGTSETDQMSGYKVVCYYTNWSFYRQGEGKYLPEDVDPSLCTHINYAFAVLDRGTLLIKPHDSWADIDNNFYERLAGLKRSGAKVLIAIGGWNDSRGDKYSRLVNDPQARRRFNEHVLEFIQKYDFDGLDLDWEYPKCWQVDCKKGPVSDKQGFSDWIKELSTLFKPYGLLLTAAVSPSYKVMKHAYDVPVLSTYLDFINVMTYDYHGQWDKQTGHVAPMFSHPDDFDDKFNTDFTINHWIDLGADPKKLILGLPMYGQSFTLAQSKDNGLNQKTYGGGEAGPYTRARGFLAYYEICYFIKHQSWTVVRDPLSSMGPYAYKGNQWVGFDDIPQIKFKAEYIKNRGLGGAMIWALDLDDSKNRCDCETYPLLKTINRVLNNYPPPAHECPLLGGGHVGSQGLVPSQTQRPTRRPTPPRPTTVPEAPKQRPTDSPVPKPQPTLDPVSIPEPAVPQGPSVGMGTAGSACKAGEFRRHEDCNKFYECYMGKFREVSCYSGLHYDGRGRCVESSRSNCRSNRIQPPTSPVFPSANSIIATPGLRDPVQTYGNEGEPCSGNTFKRHRLCNKFYHCLHGKLMERTCLPGLHWDGQGKCAWPDQANCQQQAGAGPALPPLPTQPPKSITTYRPAPTTTAVTTRRTTTTTTQRTYTTRSSTRWYVPWTPSTEPTTPRPTHPPGSLEIDGYKVVCYFTNWAWYRRGVAKYKPEDIDYELCTHVIYGFAVLDANKLVIKPHDTWADFDNKFYQKVTSLKAKGIRVLIAIGGWNDSKGGKYSKLVNNPAARAKFTSHVVEFIEKHNFDGLDLDWEYPKCWQVDCSKGPDSDKDAFSAWMRELRAAFTPRNWLLTAAVSPSYKVIDAGYNVADLTKYLDFVNVMTYDYHGHWDKQTGHVAPMFHHEESIAPEFNANYTINYFIEKGADRKKLIMGMPLYGQAFTLRDPSKTGLNSEARKGQAGEFTRAAGFLAYYEICNKVLQGGYTVVKDPSGSIGPYAYKGNQWVGFDDVSMIRFKSQFIKRMGLGGGMIWALDLDDFNNRCNCEPHPLLRTINRELRNYPSAARDCSLG